VAADAREEAGAEVVEQTTGGGGAQTAPEGKETAAAGNKVRKRPAQATQPEPVEIEIDMIETDDSIHPRDHVDKAAVREYKERMVDGDKFPPIHVFRRGGKFVGADGRHRLLAAKAAGFKTISAVIHEGSLDDATLFAIESAANDGVRRTNADKRKSVGMVLSNKAWQGWNDSEIARRCKVSADLVKSVKAECGIGADDQEPDGAGTQLVLRNGKEEKQKRKAAAKPLPAHIAAIGEMRELAQKARAAVTGDDPGLAERLQHMDSELHEILGKATGAKELMTEGLREPLNVYEHELKGGVAANPEFKLKGLADHDVNVGLSCGHLCTYCSSSASRCRNAAYGELQLNPYGRGFAVIDPKTAERILKDMPKLTEKHTIMLSTCDDAWSPEALKRGIGRKSVEALLKNTPAKVRILTKSAEVAKDFGVIKGFESRVMVGLSLGIPEDREDVAVAVEPNASPIRERLKALKQAHDLGIPTYAMLCPCLPQVADTEAALTGMFKAVKVRGADDIWLEPVNARGKALQNTADALRIAGLSKEADAVDAIRKEASWSKYAADLAETAVKVADKLGMKAKLRVLMYADKLAAADLGRVKALGGSVILLGKGADAGVKGTSGIPEQTAAPDVKDDADDAGDQDGDESGEESGTAT
jgi:DNA repair photolyase